MINTTPASGETVESGGSLTLLDTTSITGGQLTNKGTLTLNGSAVLLKNGALVNTGTVNAQGVATLDGETVNNDLTGVIAVTGGLTLDHNTAITNVLATNAETIAAGASMTLLDTTSITGGKVDNKGTLTLNGSAVLLKNGSLVNTGTVNAQGVATLDGKTVNNDLTGVIAVTGDLTLDHNTAITNVLATNAETIAAGASMTLLDTTSITGGKIDNKGTLTLNGSAVILKNGSLVNTGTINAQGVATLDGETVNNDLTGVIAVTGGLTLDHNTAITNVLATNAETIASGASMTLLDTTSITGGKVDNKGTLTLNGSAALLTNGSLVNTGTVNAQGVATLDGETVNNDLTGLIDITGDLTLDHNTAITNVLATNAETIAAGASMTLLDTTSITGGKVDNKGTLTLNGSAVLLKNGALVNTGTVNAQGVATLDNETVNNDLTGVIAVTGDLTLDHNTAITNVLATNAETIAAGASMTLLDTTSITGGKVDNKGTLTLNGSAVLLKNGALVNTGTVNAAGVATLDNETVNNDLTGVIAVTGDLTLDHNTAITNVLATNAQSIAAGALMAMLDTTSITGGKVDNKGTLTLNGSAVLLKNGSLVNTGTVNAQGVATLDGEAVNNDLTGVIAVTGGLTLDHNTAIANVLATNAETIAAGASLTLLDTTSVTGGKVDNKGTLDAERQRRALEERRTGQHRDCECARRCDTGRRGGQQRPDWRDCGHRWPDAGSQHRHHQRAGNQCRDDRGRRVADATGHDFDHRRQGRQQGHTDAERQRGASEERRTGQHRPSQCPRCYDTGWRNGQQ